MKRILVIGADGGIARQATRAFEARFDCAPTLYVCDAGTLADSPHPVIEGAATDGAALRAAMQGQDVVFANLSQDIPQAARAIVEAMWDSGPTRLIFVTRMGIHDEVPDMLPSTLPCASLDPHREAARIIEGSGLDYTLVRPGRLTDRAEIAYATTRRGEPFANPTGKVSNRSVANLVLRLATEPGFGRGESFGVHAL